MKFHTLTRTLIPLALIAVASCATPMTNSQTAGEADKPVAADAKADKGKDDAKAAEAKADELRKKQRELDYAKLQLEITRLDVAADERGAKTAVDNAERDLANAKLERDNFMNTVKPLEIADHTLSLDRSKQYVTESEQELKELETMYSKEEFAGTTKELVLTRGRNRLDMAKRDLDLSKKRNDQMTAFEHPKRERDLTVAVERATQAASEAHAKLDKGTLEHKLTLLKAEHGIEDLQREIEKLQKPPAG